MAIAATYGPRDRFPDRFNNEFQYARLLGSGGSGEEQIVSAGGGVVHTIAVGVAGTTLTLHDVDSDGTADPENTIATLSLAALTSQPVILDVAFGHGLRAVMVGNADVTISFLGRQMVSSRTFGVQASSGRPVGE